MPVTRERYRKNGVMNMSVEMFSLYFRSHNVFRGLDERQVGEIFSAARQNILKKGSCIVVNRFHSNRVYFLVKGKMKIADGLEGSDTVVKDILYAGEMFGNVSLDSFQGEEWSEALVNDTIVYCFGVSEFKALIKRHHGLALNYADNINRKFSLLKERYEVWTRYDTKTRFIYLLHKWAKAEGVKNNDRIILHNYLSLTDIADILSVSRQFMHILIKEMAGSGQLKYGRKQIELDASVIKEFYPN